MSDNHPITPTLKLFREWTEYRGTECEDQFWWRIATQAARWGADQELEACCEWLQDPDLNVDTYKLRAVRRPKPPSLKEQALEALDEERADMRIQNYKLVRSVLESLPD